MITVITGGHSSVGDLRCEIGAQSGSQLVYNNFITPAKVRRRCLFLTSAEQTRDITVVFEGLLPAAATYSADVELIDGPALDRIVMSNLSIVISRRKFYGSGE